MSRSAQVARQDFSTAKARRAVVESGNSATSSPAWSVAAPGPAGRYVRWATEVAPIEVMAKRWQVPNRPRGSRSRVAPAFQRNSSLNPGISAAASSRSLGSPPELPPSVVGGSEGSGAVVVSTGVVGAGVSLTSGAGDAGVVVADAAGGSFVSVAGSLHPARAKVARHARVAAATVGRARARVGITDFLTVTGAAGPA